MRTNKVYNHREFIIILRKNGFEFDRCHGDHSIYKRNGKHISVSKNLNRMVCERLIKENHLIV